MAEVYYHHFPISARFTFQRRLFGCLFQYIFANENKPQASSFPSTLSVVALPEVTKHTPPLPPPPPAALPRPAMGLFDSAQCRLLSMLTLTFSFFMVELVVGYISNSTALIADSFHMLSDVVALVIAYVSIRMSPKKWSKNTFGWARAEVLGALINAVFLLALCFSIFVEALKRFVDPESLHKPKLVLVVGVIGLVVNIIGLFLFHEGHGHGHSHGGGGGGGHSHAHIAVVEEDDQQRMVDDVLEAVIASDVALGGQNAVADAPQTIVIAGGGSGGGGKSNGTAKHKKGLSESSEGCNNRRKKSRNMNMHGVFLHVLADALGSVIVIISALIVWLTDWQYNVYVDPALSVFMVLIIGYSTFPLLKDSALILLQTVPTHIQVDSLQRKLLQEIEGVLAVHEFHVWQLAGDRIIASAHIRCRNLHDYQQIAEKVKEFFHNEGIHSTTIQPEFVEFETEDYEEYDDEEHHLRRHVSGGSGAAVTFKESGGGGKSAALPPPPNGSANLVANGNRRYRDNCALDCPPGPGDCMQNTCCGPQQRRTPTHFEADGADGAGVGGGSGKKSSQPKHSPTAEGAAAQAGSSSFSTKQPAVAAKAGSSSSSSSSSTASLPQESSKGGGNTASNQQHPTAKDNVSQASSNDGSDTGSTSKLTKETGPANV